MLDVAGRLFDASNTSIKSAW